MKIAILLIVGSLVVSAVSGFFVENLRPVEYLKDPPVVLDIPQGIGFNEITERIKTAGLIRSKKIFKTYAVLSGKANRIQGGGYSFSAPVSALELLKILTEGPREISMTIFPGMTLKEIDARLSELSIVVKGKLLDFNFDNLTTEYPFLKGVDSLEGYLLPDTYYFYENTRPETLVRKILDNFKERALPFFRTNDNVANVLKIASFLEKEIPDNDERRIAAGIIEKRLKNGIFLQIDATVIYAKCSGRFLDCPELFKDDFKIKSPYNTYLHVGLPPTPIGNPSVEAIKSVIEKKNSPYWYYLSDPKTKKTIFSKDFDEHNRNRVKYLLNNR